MSDDIVVYDERGLRVVQVGKRWKIVGFAVCPVMRWMGQQGWEFQDAERVLGKLKVEMADSTINIQLRAGATHKRSRGEPASLTASQISELCRMRDKP